jgi:flagellar FliL protein
MAEPAKTAAAPAAPAATPKKKGKLLIIIVAVVVLVGGGVGAWLALKGHGGEAKAAAPKPAAPHAAALYYKFDPPFVVNFGGEGSARYLQVTLEAMSRDAAILDEVKGAEPAIRNDLVLLYSSQDNATLMSIEGKEKLRAATLDAIRKVIAADGKDGNLIEAVYFTSFVIQ